MRALEDSQPIQEPSRRGRPREFDADAALSIALEMFLARGYAGSSLTELTAAMGISRPSLYHCFGSKEELFKLALALHARKHLAYLRGALDAPTAREAAQKLLCGALNNRQVASGVRGFMGMLSSLPGEPEVEDVRKEIAAHQAVVIEALTNRFAQARELGEFPQSAHPAALAYFLEALVYGIAVQERNGAPMSDLEELVNVALFALERPGLAAVPQG